MIAAIADDLTGAAEIAGLGWRHGLDSKILRRNQPPVDAGLLVYDSDSRNSTPTEAFRRVAGIARRLGKRSPRWIFKKVDSVLRGNVLSEVEALRQTLGLTRCILVPANPSAQRIIKNGRYFIGGKPLDRTDFRNDPTHPRRSARVIELLAGDEVVPVALRKVNARALPAGVIVGDAASGRDLQRWAQRIGGDTLAAGGGELFAALLAQDRLALNLSPRPNLSAPLGRTLFVCGSLSEPALCFIAASRSQGWPVFTMPVQLFEERGQGGRWRTRWAREIAAALEKHPKVVMTIGQAVLRQCGGGRRLERMFSETARQVVESVRPECICVEGGSTAAALLGAMNWTRLAVQCEYARGVTGVCVEGATDAMFVLKPGSYAWPGLLLA